MATLLRDLGQASLVAGTIDLSAGTAAAITDNDGSTSLTYTGTGDCTVTFGQPFLSAPVVVGNVVDATFAATDGAHVVEIVSVATNTVQFRVLDTGGSAANGAVANLDFHFMAFGLRNL